jgi:hypothetical protein
MDVATWMPDGYMGGHMSGYVSHPMSQQVKPHLDKRLDVVLATTREHIFRLVMAGWRLDYNLFRTQPELSGLTPAKMANVNERFESWATVVAVS